MIAYHQGLDLAVFSQSSGGENSWMESEAVVPLPGFGQVPLVPERHLSISSRRSGLKGADKPTEYGFD
jgi:hypothetical protein